MLEAVPALLALSLLLILVSMTGPLARRLGIPFTTLLAAVGLALGLLALMLAPDAMQAEGEGGLILDLLGGLGLFGVNADALIYVFLPLLLFNAGLGVDLRLLRSELAAVLLMAVVAVAVCVVIVGGLLSFVSGFSLAFCMLLGAIVAATDPAAVIAIFRDLGAPRRLTTLVSGESLFNDAAAIAFFALLLDVVVRQAEAPRAGEAVAIFIIGFAGGLLLGVVLARLAVMLFAPLQEHPLAATTLSIALAYLAFVVGQDYLQVSGVVAVVVAALTLKVYGPAHLPPKAWDSLNQVWETLDFWANSLIFLLASMLAARVLPAISLADLGLLGLLVLAALASRGFVLYALLPFLTLSKLVQPIDHRYRAVLIWGGLRGAVTLLLALAVASDTRIFVPNRDFVAVLATSFVFFTLFAQGPSLKWLLRLLDLDKLTASERDLRDRVITQSNAAVRDQVRQVADAFGLRPEEAEKLLPPPPHAVSGDEDESDGGDRPDRLYQERLRSGLRILLARERDLLLAQFQGRIVSRRVIGPLLAALERMEDEARAEGREGVLKASAAMLGPNARFKLSNWLHTRMGIEGPLARAMGDRIEQLELTRYLLGQLQGETAGRLAELLGDDVARDLEELMEQRRGLVELAIGAAELQYTDYVAALRRQFVVRAALRFEDAAYRRHLDDNLIGRDLFSHLEQEIAQRHDVVRFRPKLTLGLDLLSMMARVPVLAELDQAQQERLARRLSARIAFPGERIVTKGERGDAMFFIASGEAEVRLPETRLKISTGDFFGEMALVYDRRRNADVVARGFCHLLVLPARDFRRLLRADSTLKARIEEVAESRRSEIG